MNSFVDLPKLTVYSYVKEELRISTQACLGEGTGNYVATVINTAYM